MNALPGLPSGPDTFNEFVAKLCDAGDWFFTFVMIIAVIMIIVAAFHFLTAGGDANKIREGKMTLVYAVVGIIIAILPNAIIRIIGAFLGAGNPNPCT